MPDTLTSFFGFTKPALHSTGWGPKANTDFDSWDSVLGIPRAAFKAPTVGGTTTLDLSLGSAFAFTLNQTTTLVFSNPAANPAGVSTQVWQGFRLLMVGDGTRRAVTWPISVSWLAGQVPVLTPGGSDFFEFFTKDNGATWLGVHLTVTDLPATTATTYNAAGTTNIDLALNRFFKFTVAGGISTIAFINITQNVPSFRVSITNGGLFAQTWPGTVVWLSGAAPKLQSAGVDLLEFTSPDGGTTWYGARVDPASNTAVARVKATKVASTALPVGTPTAIAFDGVDEYDTNNLHDPASNNTEIIIPADSLATEAEISAQIVLDSVLGQSDVNVTIVKNAATVLANVRLILPSGGTFDTSADGLSSYPLQIVAYDNAPVANTFYRVLVKLTGGSNHNAVAGSWFRAKLV
jgi:hypothetical protein